MKRPFRQTCMPSKGKAKSKCKRRTHSQHSKQTAQSLRQGLDRLLLAFHIFWVDDGRCGWRQCFFSGSGCTRSIRRFSSRQQCPTDCHYLLIIISTVKMYVVINLTVSCGWSRRWKLPLKIITAWRRGRRCILHLLATTTNEAGKEATRHHNITIMLLKSKPVLVRHAWLLRS